MKGLPQRKVGSKRPAIFVNVSAEPGPRLICQQTGSDVTFELLRVNDNFDLIPPKFLRPFYRIGNDEKMPAHTGVRLRAVDDRGLR